MKPTLRNNPNRRALAGGLSGVLAGAAGVALTEAVAAVVSGVTSPLLSVSNRSVDMAPRPVKEWAISTFGSADKAVLLAGVVTTIAVALAVLGTIGPRRPRVAVAMLVSLSLFGAAAAATDRTASAGVGLRLVAPAVGLVGSVGALWLLLRTLRPRPPLRPTTRATESDQPAVATAAEAQHRRARLALPSKVHGDELPAAFDRRRFLATALAVGAVAAAGGAASRMLGSAAAASRAGVLIPRPGRAAPPVPDGASFDIEGLSPHLSSNREFYRVDTALQVPDVPVDTWSLRIRGMVDEQLDLTFEDLLSRRLVERRITLTCVSNQVGGALIDNTTWIGVPVAELLAEAGIRDGADAVRSTSVDGMTIGTPLSALTDGRAALLALAMGGEPLPLEHGFPVRMVVSGLYGYVSATKWLVDLEVTRFADFRAYWTDRGYAAEAPIKTSSRIDVPRSFARLDAGPVAVAGLAWSQRRGIDRVEVRADEGPWHEARLAAEDNQDTWRQWRWMWDATPGTHRLEARARDRTGYTQTSRREPVAPDGATGWHSVTVTVR
ncbi:MAG: molybdopterin-dependent oxidoreductase [Carbonactinosporaceae bacterium]